MRYSARALGPGPGAGPERDDSGPGAGPGARSRTRRPADFSVRRSKGEWCSRERTATFSRGRQQGRQAAKRPAQLSLGFIGLIL